MNGILNGEFAEMISRMDTVQFNSKVRVLRAAGAVFKPACVSCNDVGVSILIPPSEVFALAFGDPVKVNFTKIVDVTVGWFAD
jgi:hypothetical protein